ncbi:MAG: ATP-binding cassette domain-containing protein [Gemmatimonadaceae bacterium]
MRRLLAFVRFLWLDHRGEIAVVAAATLALSLTEGIGLLMLVPMLRLVGVSPGDGATGALAHRLEAVLRGAGIAPTLVGVLAVVVALVTARALLQWFLAVRESALEARVVGRLRERLFAAVVQVPWARFAGERPAALVHAIGPQVDDVHSALLMLLHAASLLAAAAAALAVAMVVAPQLTLVVALSGGLLFLVARGLRAPGHDEGEQLLAAATELFARISELLGGLKMVHAHGAESRAVATVAAQTAAWSALTRRTANHRARVSFALTVLSVGLLAVLVWGGIRVAGVPPAVLLLLLLLYARLVPRLTELQSLASALAQAMASFDSVWSLLARCEAARDGAERLRREARGAAHSMESLDSGERLPRAPSVEVRDITVRYPGSATPALAHFSARFPSGSVTVVMGASGAGKTTLGDVLLGLLDAERGAVLVDGQPMAGLVRATWRERVGYLAQEPMLLHGTIRENLLFAQPGATEAAQRAALRAAACDFVDALPQGLDAPLGERGVMVSGGERQRLALARALLREPGLLVLDEATSALDAETEQRILQTVRSLSGRCTVVFCTHRAAPRAIADQVIEI